MPKPKFFQTSPDLH